jgi:4-amino-4-deoxy-L-arabinose transferase-like glycosyltransferase
MTRASARRWAVLAVALGVVLIIITICRTSLTADEPYTYTYAHRIVFEGSFARPEPIDVSKLPILALNALPERIAVALGLDRSLADPVLGRLPLIPQERAYIRAHLPAYAGRVVTVGFYVLLCALVFCWGAEVYGPAGALGATVLIAFLPTLLGHAGLVTTDAAATCMIFAATYALARCVLDPTLERAIIAGVACGVALLTKYSAIALGPIAFVLVGIRALTAEGIESRAHAAHAGAVSVLLAGVVATVAVSAGFGFQHPITPLTELACESRSLHALRGWLGAFPLPLPFEFLHGLDLVLRLDQDGTAGGLVYLCGRLSRHGLPSYYAVATLLKTPLAFLVLLFTRPWRWHRRYTDLIWLVPILWFFAQMSFSLQSQVGIRYVLPAFPFMALLAGGWWDHGRSQRWHRAATVLAGLCILEAVANCPRYLSYFNQLIGSRRNAYLYLADSNLDWGQGRFALWRWEAKQGGRYVLEPKYMPCTGIVVVPATEFVGVLDPEAYRWLREAQKHSAARLVGTIGDAFLVFDVRASSGGGDGPPGEQEN